jgi:gamma-glutamylcyclotransferase (GGCT)/AIG2-like uncharacterized protein YtfP
MMVSLFTYGTLMLPEILGLIVGRTCHGEDAILHNFKRRKIRNELYPGITPAIGEKVDGKIYHLLQPDEINKLTAFEGDAYELLPVTARSRVDGDHDCLTYIIKEKYLFLMTDHEWSPEDFIRHHKDMFIREYKGWQYL